MHCPIFPIYSFAAPPLGLAALIPKGGGSFDSIFNNRFSAYFLYSNSLSISELGKKNNTSRKSLLKV